MIGTASECASVALSFTCTDPSLPSLPPVFGYSMIAIYVGANSYIVDSFPEVRSSRAFLDDTLLLTLWLLFLQFASSAMASKTLLSRLCGGAIPMLCVSYSLLNSCREPSADQPESLSLPASTGCTLRNLDRTGRPVCSPSSPSL